MNSSLYNKEKYHPPSHERAHPWQEKWISRYFFCIPALSYGSRQEQAVVSVLTVSLHEGTHCLSHIFVNWIDKIAWDNKLTSKHDETIICILLPFSDVIDSLIIIHLFLLKNISPTQGIIVLQQNCNYWAVWNSLQVTVRGRAGKCEYWLL